MEPDFFDFAMAVAWAALVIGVGAALAGALVAWQFDVTFLRAVAGAAAGGIVIAAGRLARR